MATGQYLFFGMYIQRAEVPVTTRIKTVAELVPLPRAVPVRPSPNASRAASSCGEYAPSRNLTAKSFALAGGDAVRLSA